MLPSGKQLGGAPANFVYHARSFGLDATAISARGKDVLGKALKDGLDDAGLDYYLPYTDYATGTVEVELDAKGVPSYQINEKVAWDNIPYDERVDRLARECGVVCFGSLAQRSEVSRKTINRFLDAMPKTSIRIFDINLRQHYYSVDVIEASLNRSTILKINDEELLVVQSLLGLESASHIDSCHELRKKFGLEFVILTCGTQGSYVVSESDELFRPTPVVDVVDTVGAGDSFTAAFCAGLLTGKSLSEAHQLAVRVSAWVCTQHGAMPHM